MQRRTALSFLFLGVRRCSSSGVVSRFVMHQRFGAMPHGEMLYFLYKTASRTRLGIRRLRGFFGSVRGVASGAVWLD